MIGINKEETDYANEGGWVDGDKIRFRKGRVELLSISFTSVILYSFQKVKYTPTGNHAHVER